MSRKHLFPLVVIMAAAVFAGLLAVSHTRALSSPGPVATSDPTIAFQLKKLDRFERSLRRQLAATPAAASATTVYRTGPVQRTASRSFDDDHGGSAEHEDGERDD
jgi:hypothetical protein